MIIDVTRGKGNWEFPKMPMISVMDKGFEDLIQIKTLVVTTEDHSWLNEASNVARNTLNSDTKELIKEAKKEVEKAKLLLKDIPFCKKWYYLIKNKWQLK